MQDTQRSPYLRPALSDEFLPPVSRWISLSGIILLLACGAIVTLASLVKYKVTVKTNAVVRPAGEVRIVQAQMAGTVKSIAVKENQLVRPTEIIARLDDSALQMQKSQLEGNIQQGKLQLEHIDAQLKALENQINAERDRNQRAIASAQAELLRTQRDYQDSQVTTQTQAQEAEANLSIAQKELQQSQAELKSAQANLQSTQAALEAAKDKRNRYEPIFQQGAISEDRFEEVKLTVKQQEQALEAQKAVVEGHQQAVARQQQAINAAQARLAASLSATNPSPATVTISQERIAQEKAQGQVQLASLNQDKQALKQRRLEVEKQLASEVKEQQKIDQELAKTVIRANTGGIILQLNLRNPSQVVHQSDAVAQIAPSDVPLVAKAKVTPHDIDKVVVGQSVRLRISACPYPDYGILEGRVRTVSPDAIAERSAIATEQENNSTASYFEATIQPETTVLAQGNQQCPLQSGMEAAADIIAKEENALQFVLRKARLLTNL